VNWVERPGIRASRTSKGDDVVAMEVVAPHTQILTVTQNGYGKRSQAAEYGLRTGRVGHFYVKRTPKTGDVVGVITVTDDDEVMVISNKGKIIRLK